jgi:hypothetical protein
MKCLPEYTTWNDDNKSSAEVHAEQRPLPVEPASSLSYQLVTIVAAVLLVVSAAVPW